MGDRRERTLMDRKDFLKISGMGMAALALGSTGMPGNATTVLANTKGAPKSPYSFNGFGPLVKDPGGVIDLPKGFQYRILSEEGKPMTNGAPIPGDFDGMASFQGPQSSTILVRNHELSGTESAVPGKNPYNRLAPGGTTALIIGPDRKVHKEYVTSSGTMQNCAGGPTPWGTWLTCEETRTDGHGYVFEVMPDDPENKLSKTPIREMGFFSHEATAIDPATGIVYLTEDDFRGTIDPDDPANDERSSFLYRYIPKDRSQKPGALQKGGKLQAMAIEEKTNPDADFMNPGQKFGVIWKDVNKEEPHDDALNKGCVRFNRLEGASFAGGVFWFDDTAGGEKRLGQIYRYIPATETLELFYEGTDVNKMESPDNIVIAPWGDLIFAEDGPDGNRVMGITPEGEVYDLAYNRISDSEFCGPTFSPDGKTLFLNIQSPGLTFAIWGPFGSRNAGRQRQMGHAAPPRNFAPQLSPEMSEIAKRSGISELEAAAFHRHGVKLV
ncbi:PhoX family protein [Bacillus sp. Marseille-Q3570]|uniref:PhoX family protein n=1 Tax=Bacillus sp. Marseille-Q3570 TaxID=2963522 RepID=UPI0021B78B06|nr:PhoX family protein [Bacillus sp. Marseille-Q3570]